MKSKITIVYNKHLLLKTIYACLREDRIILVRIRYSLTCNYSLSLAKASLPFIPTSQPYVFDDSVIFSNGAFNKSSIVLTPFALPAITCRSAKTVLNKSTSKAAHIMYPVSFVTINKLVLGNSTRIAVNNLFSISIGSTDIIKHILLYVVQYNVCNIKGICHFLMVIKIL